MALPILLRCMSPAISASTRPRAGRASRVLVRPSDLDQNRRFVTSTADDVASTWVFCCTPHVSVWSSSTIDRRAEHGSSARVFQTSFSRQSRSHRRSRCQGNERCSRSSSGRAKAGPHADFQFGGRSESLWSASASEYRTSAHHGGVVPPGASRDYFVSRQNLAGLEIRQALDPTVPRGEIDPGEFE